MIKWCLPGLLLFCCLRSSAQYAGYAELLSADAFKKSFSLATASTESLRADFTQEKSLSMLSEKMISSGKFQFRKKDNLRLEYLQPYRYLMILSGGRIYVKDDQKENKVSAGSNPVFQQINRILIDCVSGGMLNNPEFQYRVFENSGSYQIEFKPLNSRLRELFKNINIILDKKDLTASSIGMYEVSGDKTIIRFQNTERNVQIPESVFTIP